MAKINLFYQTKVFSLFLLFSSFFLGGRWIINTLAIFLIINIISYIKEGFRPINEFPKAFWIPLLFYLAHFLASLNSENIAAAHFDLEVKLSFLLMPLFLGFSRFFDDINFQVLIKNLLVATFIHLSGLIIHAAYAAILHSAIPTYREFSIFLHPAYFSMYIVLVGILSSQLQSKANKRWKILGYATIILGLISILLANSKAGILITLLFITFEAIQWTLKKNKVIGSTVSFSLLGIVVVLMIFNSRIHKMITESLQFEEIINNPGNYVESTGERIISWYSASQIIAENWILGVGNGDVQDQLSEKYTALGFSKNASLRLNAHNQYLESFLGLGLGGLTLLLVFLGYPIFRYKSKIISEFIILIGLNFLFESMLNTQAGVLFIVFTYYILINYQNRMAKAPTIN